MVIAYVPAFTVFLFIVIVNPGPTVPVSVLVLTFVFVAPNVEAARASAARIDVSAAVISRMKAPWSWRDVSPRQRRGVAPACASRRPASRDCGYPPATLAGCRDVPGAPASDHATACLA